jgi:ferritin-like metal-binding protein YciE
MENLERLFVDELKDVYNAEKQIVAALPRMADAAQSEELRTAFRDHLKQTQGHVERLEKILDGMGEDKTGKKCEGMEGIIKEADHLLHDGLDPDVMDAALIGAAQKVEHYEIATYGTLRTFAEHLGEEEAAGLLQKTLDEEDETDRKLTDLALSGINQDATDSSGSDEA